MTEGTISSLTCVLFFCALTITVAQPTLGHVDRNRLETYEDLTDESNDFDHIFGNLTFRFSCENMPVGLYADTDYNCKIFHACDEDGTGFPVICPNGTYFDQRQRICTGDEKVDCENAEEWFYLNEMTFSEEVTEHYELNSTEKEDVPSVLPLILP